MQAVFDRLAATIAAELKAVNPVLLAVMYGGVYAAVQLSMRLTIPHEFDYVHLTRYRGGLDGGEIHWELRPRASLRGRVVLVVDDILDRGHTLDALLTALQQIGVAHAYTAVLVAKSDSGRSRRPAVDFVGVEVAGGYVFGCGMDYKGHWRGLSSVFMVQPQ
jgi:hypoxanthine phosphoribosyltransferase